MVSDANTAHKLYAVGDFPKVPTGDFCAVPQMRTPDAEIDMPAIPQIPTIPTTPMIDEGKPAVEATHYVYKWSNVNFLVRPDAIGTQMAADLDYTRNGCTAKYRVKGVYPARNCESRDDAGAARCGALLTRRAAGKGHLRGLRHQPGLPGRLYRIRPRFARRAPSAFSA